MGVGVVSTGLHHGIYSSHFSHAAGMDSDPVGTPEIIFCVNWQAKIPAEPMGDPLAKLW
jgi:hypothetical protein